MVGGVDALVVAVSLCTVAGVSQFLHPIGPEPPIVYWIRRVAILLVVIAVIVGLVWVFGALRGGSSEVTAAPSASAAPSGSASAPASPSAIPTGAPTDCKDADIEVSASTDSGTYPIGATPRLTLTITNSGDVPCLRDVGPKANSLEITSGGYHVWSSDDCNPNDKTKVVTLQPGEDVAATISWNGKVTQRGCPNEGTPAKPGRYDLIGINLTKESDKVPFALTKKKG